MWYAPPGTPASTFTVTVKGRLWSPSIAGTVLASDGRTPVGARLRARPLAENGDDVVVSTSYRTGRFEIHYLISGQYRLSVESVGWPQTSLGIPPAGDMLVDAGKQDVEIVLDPGAWLTLIAKSRANDQPVSGPMRVEFAGGGELSFDARGPRKFPSPFGARHSMRVFMDGYLPSEPVSVLTDRSRPSQNVEFLLDPDPETLAHLELEVVDDAGTPLNRVIINGSTGTFVKPHQVLELSNGRTDLKFLPGSYGFVLGATGTE